MNCRQCGNPLTGMEAVCPNCGTPVQNEVPVVDPNVQPIVEPQPVMQEPTPVMVEPQPVMQEPTPVMPEAAPVMPEAMMNPAPVGMEPAMTPAPEGVPEGAKESNNKKLIIGIAVLLVILVGVMIYFVVFAGGNKEKTKPTPTPTPAEEEQQQEETPTETVFGKFNIAIPEGFTSEVVDEKFLLLQKDGFSILFGVDYTNAIAGYLSYFNTLVPDAEKYQSMFQKIGTHDYLIYREIDPTTTGEIAQFVSPGNGVVYTGVLYHKDGATVSTDDIQVLDNLITNIVVTETEETTFKEDVGTAGIYDAPIEVANFEK